MTNMAYRTHVLVCAGTGCVSGKSYATAKAIEMELAKQRLEDDEVKKRMPEYFD